MEKKTIEEEYIKLKDMREHLLLRPETYSGSIITEKRYIYIANKTEDNNININQTLVDYNPAFVKIFDEILTNASDHVVRTNKVKTIKINITSDTISIYNDGPNIPITIHKGENIYLPEMLLFNFMSGSNYDDNEARYGAGRNGVGGTLTNTLSMRFLLETNDGNKKYSQVSTNNLSKIEKPIIEKSKEKESYTRITYTPDFVRFGMTEIDEVTKNILFTRVISTAAYCQNVKVYFNDWLIPIRTFKDYMKMFVTEEDELFYEKIDENWEFGIAKSDSETFKQMSIVNGILTYQGGKHVNAISNILINAVKEQLDKKYKKLNISYNTIKNHMFLFVNSKVVNPSFNAQTKEELTSAITDKLTISDKFIKSIVDSSIVEDIISLMQLKEKIEIQKTVKTGTRVKIKKLDDANRAGTSESKKCALFLAEGLSAAASVISGFSVVGRNYFGVYPLKGKIINVRRESLSKVKDNEELIDVVKALGLEFGKKYTTTDGLRYGKIVFMTDADCIDENTRVITKRGEIKIKDLTYDDEVLTHNNHYKPITNIIKKTISESISIEVHNNKYKFGLTHKIPVLRNEIIQIIKVNDMLMSDSILFQKNSLKTNADLSELEIKNFKTAKPTNITYEHNDIIVYDITVEDDKSFYIVDNDRMLVHNCDGFHIKGLLINVFEYFWPELLTLDFLYEFTTPIIRLKKGLKTKYIYTLNEYNKWKKSNEPGYDVTYFKGLGSLESEDIKLFFKEIDKHLIKFNYTDTTKTWVNLGFDKKADERKDWMSKYEPLEYFDKFSNAQTYESFFKNEFIEFLLENAQRSIPSMVDGFKTSQRKVMHTLIRKNYSSKVKVVLLAGAVLETSAYHHSEMSLYDAIVGMAQDFVGTNNLNLLEPKGMFGTRLRGGEDAASPRYINTMMSDNARNIFISNDDVILEHLNDDGYIIEPKYFVPIIPMVLVNGALGIGSGWSTSIPCYNPKDIVTYLENKLDKKKNIELHPYYKNFKGTIIENKEDNNYIIRGKYEKVNALTLRITELPVGTWTENYCELLEELERKDIINSYVKNSTDDIVDITVLLSRESLKFLEDNNTIIPTFKLETTQSMKNMYLYDANNNIKKYYTVYEIIDDFCLIRLEYYKKRKKFILGKLEHENIVIENKIKFIQALLDKKIEIRGESKTVLETKLSDMKFVKIDDNFNYLLNMSIVSMTAEKIEELNALYEKKKLEIISVGDTSLESMWKFDLSLLKKKL